jgi:hypothetical protein
MNITMHPVSSKMIRSVGYDPDTRKLYVEFLNGNVYAYDNVPIEKFNKMLVPTLHVGKYFNEEVKTPDRLYTKVPYRVVLGQLKQI